MTIHPVTLSSSSSLLSSFLTGADADAVKTGTVDSTKHGHGTFAKTFEDVNGMKTIDKTVTYADGTQRTKEMQIVVNEDGSKTITKTNAHGKVTTINETKVQNADGSYSVVKDVTNPKGEVTHMEGTVSRSNGEIDKSFTMTNADGQTETLNTQTVKNGDSVTHTRTGTGYDGQEIYNESTWTTFA